MVSPLPPDPSPPEQNWDHYELYGRVREALFAVPGNFKSDVVIRGVSTTDLFSLNSLLGTAIEEGVVDTLNSLRQIWDAHDSYAIYSFVRQSQTFPDVLLTRHLEPIRYTTWY